MVLKGTVKEWLYSNPHCLLKLEVKGADGKVVEWIAEAQAPNVIFPAGYRKDSFKPGDQVTITVEPVKENQPMGASSSRARERHEAGPRLIRGCDRQ